MVTVCMETMALQILAKNVLFPGKIKDFLKKEEKDIHPKKIDYRTSRKFEFQTMCVVLRYFNTFIASRCNNDTHNNCYLCQACFILLQLERRKTTTHIWNMCVKHLTPSKTRQYGQQCMSLFPAEHVKHFVQILQLETVRLYYIIEEIKLV